MENYNIIKTRNLKELRMKTQNAFMKKNLMLILLSAAAISICCNLAQAAEIVVEVESLQLSNAQVKDHNEASGGKVVAFDDEGAEAKGEIELQPGQYTVYLIMSGQDEDHDAVNVAVGDTKSRVYPSEHPNLSKSESLSINITEKKKYQILITLGETGVLLDKLVFQPIPAPAETEPKPKDD
jgi:hypothetical protein